MIVFYYGFMLNTVLFCCQDDKNGSIKLIDVIKHLQSDVFSGKLCLYFSWGWWEGGGGDSEGSASLMR